jgi:hypothetical protein
MEKTMRRFTAASLLALGGYAIVLCTSIEILKRFELGAFKYVVVLTPMLPAGFALAIIVRGLREMDELQRQIQLEALAIAFGASAFLTFAYGFLEGAGLPHVSWIWVWPLMGMLWIVGLVISRARYR